MTQQRYCILIASIFQAAGFVSPHLGGVGLCLLLSLFWMVQAARKERHEPA